MSVIKHAELIDIHAHFKPKGWKVDPPFRPSSLPAELQTTISDLDGLARTSARSGINLRALSAPIEQLFGPEGDIPSHLVHATNYYLADLVRRHPTSFLGLATVDAFAGDAGAEQVRYAIEDLGLHGIVLDSSRKDLHLDSPEAYPTLELAAHLRVPVFVHPVAAKNGISFLSALRAELPTRLPDLHLVFTALGNGALYFAADAIASYRAEHDFAPHIYFDTSRFNPALIRYCGEALGPDRLIVGTDWPHHDSTRNEVDAALIAAGLNEAQRELVRAGNARRLFELRTSPVLTHA